MAPVYDFSHIDCGLCAAILAAKAKKASEPEAPPGSVPKHLVRIEGVTMQAKIIEYARYWTQPDVIASIKIEQKPFSKDCHIRVRVTKQLKPGTDGKNDDDWLPNWSLLGTGSEKGTIHKDDPFRASMELAILDVEDKEVNGVNMFRRRVLHEFGHAFGFDHEQERDDFQQFLKPENRTKNPSTAKDAPVATTKPLVTPVLSDIQIQAHKIANNTLTRSSVPDTKSVMMYPFNKGEMMDPNASIEYNTNLSAEDKSFSNKVYPPVAAAVPA